MTAARIVVTGSVAYDYLMTFPGKFLDVVVPDRMDRLSVSFLVDSMRRVRGGVAPNIAYGLALLGLRPLIMATAGIDALDYSRWLAEQGVDTSGPAHLRRPLHRLVLRLHRPGTEPDRDVLHRGDGARLDAVLPGALAEQRERGDHLAERSRGDGEVRDGVPGRSTSPSSTTPASKSHGSRARTSLRGWKAPRCSSRTSTSSA